MRCGHDGCHKDASTVAIIKSSGGFGDNMKQGDILLGVCKWHLRGETPPPEIDWVTVNNGLKGISVLAQGLGKAVANVNPVLQAFKTMLLESIEAEFYQMVLHGTSGTGKTKPPEPELTPLQKLMQPIKDPLEPQFELYSWQNEWYDEWDYAPSIFNKPRMKAIKTSCNKCGGHGKRGNKRCRSCHGSGRGVPMNVRVD